MKTISIVTPCYNEEGGIAECVAAVRRVMETMLPHYAYEHIIIDNASEDRTPAILRAIAADDHRVKLIFNARNFGPSRSPHHAMLEASGDAVIPVLADLQTPADLIPTLVERWEAGAKIVIAVRRKSAEPFLSRAARTAYYRTVKALSEVEQIPNFMGFGLYDRVVMDVFRSLKEPDPYFRGLVAEIGFERDVVQYDQPARLHGKSHHSLAHLVDYGMLAITSYSRTPLRVVTLVGLSTSAFSAATGLSYLVAKLLFWSSMPIGMAPVLIAVFFLGAVQLFALGMVGEYVGLLLSYARDFPLAIEKERVNLGPPATMRRGTAPAEAFGTSLRALQQIAELERLRAERGAPAARTAATGR